MPARRVADQDHMAKIEVIAPRLAPNAIDGRGDVLIGARVTAARLIGAAITDAPYRDAPRREIRAEVAKLLPPRRPDGPASAVDEDRHGVRPLSPRKEDIDTLGR
jgi:hypothetical protein